MAACSLHTDACQYFNPGFQCIATHLASGREQIVFTEFKPGFGGFCFTSYINYIHSLCVWLAHVVNNNEGDRRITRK